MLLTSRKFERREPYKDAKSIYIFCEGAKREKQYFDFFCNIDRRIKIIVNPFEHRGQGSPRGLFDEACSCFEKNKENKPKYEFIEGLDEVWFICDTDRWSTNLKILRAKCSERKGWFVAESNPCFELWLYYHISSEKPNPSSCDELKRTLNELVKGGFHSRRHPIFIEKAINNSQKNFKGGEKGLVFGDTEVYLLGAKIFELVQEKINKVLLEIEGSEKAE